MKISKISEINLGAIPKAIGKNLSNKKTKTALKALGVVALGGVIYDKAFSEKVKQKRAETLKQKALNQAIAAYEKFDYVKDIAQTSFELDKEVFRFGKNTAKVTPAKIYDTAYIVTEIDDSRKIVRMSRLNSDLNPINIVEFKDKKLDRYEFDKSGTIKNIALGVGVDKNNVSHIDENYEFENDELVSIDKGKSHLIF